MYMYMYMCMAAATIYPAWIHACILVCPSYNYGYIYIEKLSMHTQDNKNSMEQEWVLMLYFFCPCSSFIQSF